ncbi:MAG: PH domain-containing protein [Angustibacter sp.]
MTSSSGADGDPFAPFVPQRGRRVAAAFAVGALVVFGVLAVTLPATGYRSWSVGDSLLIAGFGVLVAFVMWRFAAIRAVPSREGIVVRNVAVTRRLSWAEIESVRFANGDAWAWLDLVDGDQVAVMAIQRSDGPRSLADASRLSALVQGLGPARR